MTTATYSFHPAFADWLQDRIYLVRTSMRLTMICRVEVASGIYVEDLLDLAHECIDSTADNTVLHSSARNALKRLTAHAMKHPTPFRVQEDLLLLDVA